MNSLRCSISKVCSCAFEYFTSLVTAYQYLYKNPSHLPYIYNVRLIRKVPELKRYLKNHINTQISNMGNCFSYSCGEDYERRDDRSARLSHVDGPSNQSTTASENWQVPMPSIEDRLDWLSTPIDDNSMVTSKVRQPQRAMHIRPDI
jgi:hypothetical protein